MQEDGRFTRALRGAIGDPRLRGLPPLGAADQVVDHPAVLTDAARTRSVVAAALGLDQALGGQPAAPAPNER